MDFLKKKKFVTYISYIEFFLENIDTIHLYLFSYGLIDLILITLFC